MAASFLLKDLGAYRREQFQTYADTLDQGATDTSNAPYPSDALTNPLGMQGQGAGSMTAFGPPSPEASSPPAPPPAPAPPAPAPMPDLSAPAQLPAQPGSVGAGFHGSGDVIPANVGGRAAFVQSFQPYAEYAAQRLGIDPSIVTAMAISESGGGNIPGNSFFGMKGSPFADGSINLPTWELVNGKRVNISDNFATFSTPQKAMDAWIDFLAKHTPGVFGAQSPEQFAAGLKAGGYMTDTAEHYAQTLRGIGAQSGGSGTPNMQGFVAPSGGAPAATPRTSVPGPSGSDQVAGPSGGAVTFSAPAAAPSTSGLDQFRAFADSLDKAKTDVGNAIGGAAQSGLDQFKAFADQLDKNITGTNPNQAELDQQFQQQLDQANIKLPTNPMEALGGSNLGVPNSGEEVDRLRQQAIAENNPLRDVPVLGGATTLAAQVATDPTNLVLAGASPLGQAAGKAAVEIAGAPETQALLRTRQSAQGINPFDAPPLPTSAPAVATSAPDEVARLRLDKFPDWLRPTIQQGAEDVGFAVTQRRGVIPDAQSETMADNLGRTIDEWIAGGKAGRIYNAEETRALRNVVTAQAQKVNDLSSQVASAAGRGEATDKLIAQSVAEGDKLQSLITVMEGNRAEWGRAGRAWQASTRLVDAPPTEAISEIYKALGGRDNALNAVQQYNELVQSGANPIQMAQFWAQIKNPPAGFQDWFRALRYNSMLSGPRTFEVNVIGNGLELPWRLARDTGASVIRGRPEEVAPEVAGLAAGLQKANRAFMETWANGVTTERALAGDLPQRLSDRVSGAVPKAAATALELPGRVMQASDAWAQAMAYSMAVGRRAGVMASSEGLRGTAWAQRVQELMSNPSPGMAKEATAIADRMTYHGDMGSLGNALGAVQRVPYLGNIILPFLRTVYHITARGIDRSPFGLVGTAVDVARGKYGPLRTLGAQLGKSEGPASGVAPLGERIGDSLMGTAVTAAFYQQALQGNISGAGPDDPQKRDMLRAQGWQPYSVKIGDHWVSYANWGPVAIPLDTAAAAAESQTFRKPGADVPAILTDGARRTTQLVTEQTYLQAIGTVWKALQEPDRYGSQALGQFVQSLVPYGSALNTAAQAGDEFQRQPNRENLGEFIGQSVEARLPGVRQNVQVTQDQLGRPVPNEATGANALNPLRSSTIRNNAVLQELLANGADVGEPPKSYRNVTLTPDEQRRFNSESGRYIEQAVSALMKDPSYRQFDIQSKQAALQRAVDAARTKAGAELMQNLGDAEIQRRLSAGREKRVPVPIGQ